MYAIPAGPVIFHGIVPNVSGSGDSRFTGVSGWNRFVRFPDYSLKTAPFGFSPSVPSKGQATHLVTVAGVQPGMHWARVTALTDPGVACQLTAHVSAANTVTVMAQNNSVVKATISAPLVVDAGWL